MFLSITPHDGYVYIYSDTHTHIYNSDKCFFALITLFDSGLEKKSDESRNRRKKN